MHRPGWRRLNLEQTTVWYSQICIPAYAYFFFEGPPVGLRMGWVEGSESPARSDLLTRCHSQDGFSRSGVCDV